MQNDTKFATAFLAATAVTVAVSTVIYIKTVRAERAKSDEIEKNLQLDLAAIRRSGKNVTEKIKAGFYDNNFYQAWEDMHTDMEFQKIAIRLEN